MRNLLAIVFILFFVVAYSQEIKVTYNNRILIDSTRLENADGYLKTRLIEKAQGESYELIIRKGISLYEPVIFKKDKKNKISNRSGNTINVSYKYYETIYSNKTKKEIVSSIKFAGETFLIKEGLKPINWKVMEETKKIGSYTVRKAEALVNGDHIVVWFTDEISLSAGPSFYWGLPGLVLQAQKDNRLITAIKIEPLSKDIYLAPPTAGKEYTKEEYNKLNDAIMNREEGTTRNGNTTTTITRH